MVCLRLKQSCLINHSKPDLYTVIPEVWEAEAVLVGNSKREQSYVTIELRMGVMAEILIGGGGSYIT